jgi:hypothetical protein
MPRTGEWLYHFLYQCVGKAGGKWGFGWEGITGEWALQAPMTPEGHHK